MTHPYQKPPKAHGDRGRFYDSNRLCLFTKKQGTRLRILIYKVPQLSWSERQTHNLKVGGSRPSGTTTMRVQYNGHYMTFPRSRRGFDSLHSLKNIFIYTCFLNKDNVYLIRLRRSGVMAAAGDLKSPGPKGPYGFESRLRYKFNFNNIWLHIERR